MSGAVATIALIERKPSISRSLFSRYWRDVHGVMAARIPGFDRYEQNHVSPMAEAPLSEPFEGVAVVGFQSEADRASLIESRIASFIHRDEQNVFRRALLYNLGVGDVRRIADGGGTAEAFVAIAAGADVRAIADRIRDEGAVRVTLYDLTAGDPSAWNQTDVDDGGAGRRFVGLVHCAWDDDAARSRGIAAVVAVTNGAVAAYQLDERHVMVDHGRPTTVGLRGLDAARTIAEAGADNQLEPEVVEAIYGISR